MNRGTGVIENGLKWYFSKLRIEPKQTDSRSIHLHDDASVGKTDICTSVPPHVSYFMEHIKMLAYLVRDTVNTVKPLLNKYKLKCGDVMV